MDQQPRKRLLCVGSRINGTWDIRHAGLSGGFTSFPPPEAPPHANPYVWQRRGGEGFPPPAPPGDSPRREKGDPHVD